MGWKWKDKWDRPWANVKMWTYQATHLQTACSVLNAAWLARLRASRRSHICSQCAQWRWECACSRAQCSVAFCQIYLFMNFWFRMCCIYMTRLFFPVFSFYLLLSELYPWARQPDLHGKPVQLRQQGEWGCLRRLHLPHRLWAQTPDLRRAQRLFRFLLLHYPVIGPRHGWRDTRQAAHRGTPRTSRLLRTRKHVSQSSSVVFDGSGKPDGERNVDQSVWCHKKTRTVLTVSFLKTPELRKWSMDHGNLMSETARTHRLGLLEEQRQTTIAEYHESRSSWTPSSSRRTRAPTPNGNCADKKWNFMKLINKILQKWKNYGNSRVLPYDSETKTHRRSEHYFGIIRKSTKTAKWSKLYERFLGFSGCSIGSQWKFSRYQSTSVILTSSDTWRNVEAFFRIAAPQRRAAKNLGHTWYIGKRFCTSTDFFISSVSSRIKFYLEENYWRTISHVYSGEKWKTRTRPRSEMPVRTVSQRFSHLQWRRLFRELWGRPTTTADFGPSLWQVP